MDTNKKNIWELVLKGLTFCGLVIAAIWAYHTYTDTKEKEFYSVFWNQKLSLYLETSAAASTMGTTESVEKFNQARTKYWELFFGRLSLVEGENVKHAMETFSKFVPRSVVTQSDLPIVTLQQPSYQLTLSLKQELGKSWREPFGELNRP